MRYTATTSEAVREFGCHAHARRGHALADIRAWPRKAWPWHPTWLSGRLQGCTKRASSKTLGSLLTKSASGDLGAAAVSVTAPPTGPLDFDEMSTSQPSQFEQCALASGLLTQAELEEARAAVCWLPGNRPDVETAPGDAQLADKLVELQRLNPWQAKQLLEGRTRFKLGPYKIVDSLGQGGMGQVFKGEHAVLGRTVAIKVLPLDRSTPEAIENFTREMRAQASLNHANLVQALDAGFDGNVYYLVAEFVPGCDLRKLVRRNGPLSMETAASIVSQVATGLAHAHQQGLIHRDVKPGNVLVTPDGQAKLSDLGLAGPLVGDASSDPRYGKVVGTADYLSPDHICQPRDPRPAWDIYSLGCTFYYAVTGKVPFPGGTTADKIRAQCDLRPLDPRRLNPQLDPEFVDVMADMMAKDPLQRIRTATEVVSCLAPWASPPRPVRLAQGITEGTLLPADSRANRRTAFEPGDGNLADTATSFPEVHSQAGSVSTAAADPRSTEKRARSAADPTEGACPSALQPLVILVILPLMLVLATALLWWLLGVLL